MMAAVMAAVTMRGQILSTCVQKGLEILLRAHDGRHNGRRHNGRSHSFDLYNKELSFYCLYSFGRATM
jgi:hypothetical protein